MYRTNTENILYVQIVNIYEPLCMQVDDLFLKFLINPGNYIISVFVLFVQKLLARTINLVLHY